MRLLVDEALQDTVAHRLTAAGHNTTHIRLRGLSGHTDDDVMALAVTEDRVLVTTDTDFGTILALTGPGAAREERGGVGSAGIVIYPLTPTRLLAMVRPDIAEARGIGIRTDHVDHDELDSVEVLEVAHELIAHSTRYVVEQPKRQLGLRLQVGALPAAAQSEEAATFREGDREGSLMRFFKRNRWSTAARVPPWPVARWWKPTRQ